MNKEQIFNMTKREIEIRALKLNDFNCSNCSYCFYCSGCSNCSYCSYCSDCSNCSNCYNCSNCSDCSNCFYCSYSRGLKDKSYCILNVKFTKEEYFKIKSEKGL